MAEKDLTDEQKKWLDFLERAKRLEYMEGWFKIEAGKLKVGRITENILF